MQGAILRVKLRHLEAWTESRRTRAAGYDAELARAALSEMPQASSSYERHVYPRLRPAGGRSAALQQSLDAAGVQTGIHYPIPVHLLEAWADLGYGAGSFPNAERAAARELSLPMYPELSHKQIEEVASAVKAAIEKTAVTAV